MEKIYAKPRLIPDFSNGWCPGCGHGTVHKMIAEALDTYKLEGESILVSPVGCGTLNTATGWFNCNSIACAHGRASAAATAIKRCLKDKNLVFAYQGDGDLASIGMAETIHSANRGENITVIFINNCNFGMTGGQMAPTTLLNQKSTTSPQGRNLEEHGAPIQVAEMLATLKAPKYVARVSLHDAKNVLKTRQAIMKAFELQSRGVGYTFVEILSPCPTNWKMTPVQAMKYIEETVLKTFPLGEFKAVE